ncbi:MAG: hypothetical protein ABIH26_13605 [Candidatus Eisenbacteria bacterium]
MGRWSSLLLVPLAGLAGLSGCGRENPAGPEPLPIPDDVLAFVETEGLPMQREIVVRWTLPEEDVAIFDVPFGPPLDCINGCFYSFGTGIKREGKIGWVKVDNYAACKLPPLRFYDLDSTDTFLFGEEFWTRLRERNRYYFHSVFQRWMAGDPDTPCDALRRMVIGLGEWIDDRLAWVLLMDPRVRADRELVAILADLPVFRGDAYGRVRQRAEVLLRGPKNPPLHPDEYAVYGALVDSLVDSSPAWISDSTSADLGPGDPDRLRERIRSAFPELDPDAFGNLLLLCGRRNKVLPEITSSRPAILVQADRPGPKLPVVHLFSRVGFSLAWHQALVCVERRTAAGGERFFVYLDRPGLQWRVRETVAMSER